MVRGDDRPRRGRLRGGDPRHAGASLFQGVVRGLLPLYLLTVLGERSLYGTEIMKTFSEMSRGVWKPSPGSLYPLLRKLEKDGLITGEWHSGRAAAKRVYVITRKGRKELPRLQRRLLGELRAVKGIVDLHIAALDAMVAGGGTTAMRVAGRHR